MCTHDPTSVLAPSTVYTVHQVLKLCPLSSDPAEMMILRLIDKKYRHREIPAPHKITGTGAEFQFAYQTGIEVIEMCRVHNIWKHIPGKGSAFLGDPMPQVFLHLFIQNSKSWGDINLRGFCRS